MTEFTPDKIAEDVLRLDAADGGQWVMGEVLDGAANIYGLADGDDDSPHVADRVPVALAELIVAYRNDAPILAREVNHLRQELCRTELLRQQAVEDLWKAQQQGEVPYRPGLPPEPLRRSVALWQARRRGEPDQHPFMLWFTLQQGRLPRETGHTRDGGHGFDLDSELWERLEVRPCHASGTPYPWGDL